jgi:biotin carboxyl carrier protein
MEKYHVFLRGRKYLIEIDGDKVFVDGEPYYAGIHFLNESGLFMIEKDTEKREFHMKPKADGTYLVTTRGLQVDALVEPEKGRKKKKAEKEDSGEITAPIPGVVMEIRVQVGETVEANQVLVVLESMKMLMEFRAPFAGTIEDIAVEPGQTLEKGDVMIRMEEKS